MYYRYIIQPPTEHAKPLNKWIRVSKKDWQGMTLQHQFHQRGFLELRDEYHFSSRAYALQQLWDACHAHKDGDDELAMQISQEQTKLFPLLYPHRFANKPVMAELIPKLTEAINAEATRKRIWLS